MGYVDEEINIQVLRECDGNIQYAIEKLVTLSGWKPFIIYLNLVIWN